MQEHVLLLRQAIYYGSFLVFPFIGYLAIRLWRDNRNRWIGVCEDHTVEGAPPINTIVSLDTAAAGAAPARMQIGGHDFFSSPRLSPDARWLLWLAWDHPNMPRNGTSLYLAELGQEGGTLIIEHSEARLAGTGVLIRQVKQIVGRVVGSRRRRWRTRLLCGRSRSRCRLRSECDGSPECQC